jgi:hypothetical protein
VNRSNATMLPPITRTECLSPKSMTAAIYH